MSELRRELSLFDATTINVGTMIASAIFVVPSTVALAVRLPGLAVLVWVVGGLVSLLGALCMAELGAAFPQAGGLFVYLREGIGPVWGFLYGWANAVLINPASIGAIAVVFATYLGFLVPLSPAGIKLVAVGSIAGLTALNCAGVRAGATTQNLLTVLNRLANMGNTILVIEHNLDVIKSADHIIDLGPEGGDAGGQVVATGTPEEIAACATSYTGQFLRRRLASGVDRL